MIKIKKSIECIIRQNRKMSNNNITQEIKDLYINQKDIDQRNKN